MSKVTIRMSNKGKRQVTLQSITGNNKGEGREGSGHGNQCQQSKKDRSGRHSYHQGAQQNNLMNGHTFDGTSYSQYTDQHRMISRERSFVRPHSAHFSTHAQGGQAIEELQRQRSFHQGHPQQIRDQQQYNSRSRKTSGMMPTNQRIKPAMEIYRPPTLRGPNGFDTNGDQLNVKLTNGIYAENHSSANNKMNKTTGLNIHAKEFISNDQLHGVHHSKTTSSISAKGGKNGGLQHSKSGHTIGVSREVLNQNKSSSPPKVHFKDEKQNYNEANKQSNLVSRPANLVISPVGPMTSPIKRSKSLGSADLRMVTDSQSSLVDIGPFSQDVQSSISKAFTDPNALSARILMEVVRHVFTRVIEASRYSEPTARICISIIEKEKGETFLETLLNTCQEHFQQRYRLLRNSPLAPHPGYATSYPKWIAYMSFLNEMYTQLKRRHVQLMTRRMRNSETAPGLLLLSLLAQCCQICLKEQSVNSLAETECLFFVLTAVGKDIEVELPQQMARVMSAARDAFMISVKVPSVKKTLLQLIEMHAARWQLPAPAVMYYYPGSGAK